MALRSRMEREISFMEDEISGPDYLCLAVTESDVGSDARGAGRRV